MTLNKKLLNKFLKIAGDQLSGDWLLVGGTLLPAVGLDVRSTVDIDIVGLGKPSNSQTIKLMEIAETLGLPVETINQAAYFFVNKIGYKKKDLLPLCEGPKAKIFRPSVEFYWKLKVSRLSESDVTDCIHYLDFCKKQNDKINFQELKKTAQPRKKETSERFDRLKDLTAALK